MANAEMYQQSDKNFAESFAGIIKRTGIVICILGLIAGLAGAPIGGDIFIKGAITGGAGWVGEEIAGSNKKTS